MDFITTDQAGKILGVTGRRVRALIEAGRLPAVKFGKVWMINKKDLKKVAVRPPGRPRVNGGRYGKG